jgi:outer membrane protein assembly factor BamB
MSDDDMQCSASERARADGSSVNDVGPDRRGDRSTGTDQNASRNDGADRGNRMSTARDGSSSRASRRAFLAVAAGGIAGVAGCSGDGSGSDESDGDAGSGDGNAFDADGSGPATTRSRGTTRGSGGLSVVDVTTPTREATGWPTFRYDPANTAAVRTEPATEGAVDWQFDVDDAGVSDPVLDGETVYVTTTDNELVAIDRTSGETQWTYDFSDYLDEPDEDVDPSMPVVANGTVYFGFTDLKYSREKRVSMFAVNAADGSEQWTLETDNALDYEPIVNDGTVYFHEWRTVRAVDSTSGEQLWQFGDVKLQDRLVVADGSVFVTRGGGTLTAIDSEDGTEEWTADIGRTISAPPTVIDGSLYVETKGKYAYFLSTSNSSEQVKIGTDETGVTNGTVVGDTVYAFSGERINDSYLPEVSLTSFSANDSSKQRDYDFTAEEIEGKPVVAGHVAYVRSGQRTFTAIDLRDGSTVWELKRFSNQAGEPAAVDGRVYVSDGNSLYAIS